MSRSDSRDVDQFFASQGQSTRSPEPGPQCLSDEQLAGYVGALLPARDRQALETHALACADCHELLQVLVDVIGVREPALRTEHRLAPIRTAEPASIRVIGRLVQRGRQRGLELVNAMDLVFRALAQGSPAPALGALRGSAAAPPVSDLFVIRGPGSGLDELEVQVQADGTARLTVHCRDLPALRPGEMLSVVLDVDGGPREKRPLGGEPISFAPIGAGDYRVRLTARAPGQPTRELAEASLQLTR